MPKAQPSKRNKPCEDCRKRKTKCCVEPHATTCVMCRMRKIPCSLQEQCNRSSTSTEAVSQGDSDAPWTSRNNGEGAVVTGDRFLPVVEIHPTALEDFARSSQVGRPLENGSPSRPMHRRSSFSYPGKVDEETYSLTRSVDSLGGMYSPAHSGRCDTNEISEEEPNVEVGDFTSLAQALVTPYEEVLFKLYFRTFDTIYPIIWDSRKRARYSFSNRVSGGLLSVIYLASIQCIQTDSELRKWNYPTPESVRNVSRLIIAKEIGRPLLSTLQAILIYLRLPSDTENGLVSDAWQMTCTGFALAQELNLYSDPAEWHIAPWEKKLRRRLWWKIYVAEKWNALALGRSSHIDDTEHTVFPLQLTDFYDEGHSPTHDEEQVTSWNGAISMAHLSVILSSILKIFYAVRPRTVLSSEILAIDTALGAWRARHLPRLPLSAQLELGLLDTRVATIHLMMHTVAVSFYRGLLRIDRLGPQDRESGLLSVQCATSLLQHLPKGQVDAYWPAYSRINLAIIASFLVKLVFNPTSEEQHYRDLDTLSGFGEALDRHSSWPATQMARQRLRAFKAGVPNFDNSATA